jgi:molecular chaperone DnaJ
MKVAPGTQSGTILRLRGEGFPNVHGYGQGDQLVKIAVEVPKKLSRDQQNLVKKFAEAKGRHLNPRKDEYARKLKKHYGKKKPKP